MTGLTLYRYLTIWVIIVTMNMISAQISSKTKTQMTSGVKELKDILDKGATLIDKLKPMAKSLGLFGAFFSFIMVFIPGQESREIIYMKEKFSEMDIKLDRISNQLDNLKAQVTFETQRAAHIHSANKILFAYEKLKDFEDKISVQSSCSTHKSCERERIKTAYHYVNHFNVQEDIYKIMTGTSGPGSSFANPLLDLLNKYHKCDIGKVLDFANGVISLAYKGQHAVLAYEKLRGSNHSISTSMREWSEMAYNIRKKTSEIKLQCYRDIRTYIAADIKDPIYQTVYYKTNKEAAVALKHFLDMKYPWIVWKVLSYTENSPNDHFGMGPNLFSNLPLKGDQKEKRVMRAIACDSGTFSRTSKFEDKIFSILRRSQVHQRHEEVDYAKKIYIRVENEIGPSMYNYHTSFLVLKWGDFQVASDNIVPEINRRFLRLKYQHEDHFFRLWATFKSDQELAKEATRGNCDKICQNSGTCVWLPLTAKSTCICRNFYYGDNCEHYDTVRLAANIESMLSATELIPTVADTYFKIDNVQQSITQLKTMIHEKLTTGFQWSYLLTEYSASYDELTYHLTRFETLRSADPRYNTQREELANDVVKPDKIRKWLYDLNFIIVGRNEILISHSPLIFYQMQNRKNEACNANYTYILDTTWQQLMALQTSAYMMWASSRAILHRSSDDITLQHKQKVSNQTKFMDEKTCNLVILNSVNVNCSGGYYIHPGMRIVNQCKENYYLVGDATVTCSKQSTCQPCNCYPQGSVNQECDDQTGRCQCKYGFYGSKCNDKDCTLSPWSFGECGYPCMSIGAGTRHFTRTKQPSSVHGNGIRCTHPLSITSNGPCLFAPCNPASRG